MNAYDIVTTWPSSCYSRLHCFVPAWVFGAVDSSGGFKHSVTQTNTAVGVHFGQPIVLVQLGLLVCNIYIYIYDSKVSSFDNDDKKCKHKEEAAQRGVCEKTKTKQKPIKCFKYQITWTGYIRIRRRRRKRSEYTRGDNFLTSMQSFWVEMMYSQWVTEWDSFLMEQVQKQVVSLKSSEVYLSTDIKYMSVITMASTWKITLEMLCTVGILRLRGTKAQWTV